MPNLPNPFSLIIALSQFFIEWESKNVLSTLLQLEKRSLLSLSKCVFKPLFIINLSPNSF